MREQGSGQAVRKRRLLAWAPPVAWMGTIFLLSSQPDLSPITPFSFQGMDKVAHAIAYGIFAILVRRAALPSPRAALIGWTVPVLYGMTDEFHQSFVPGRDMSIWDLVADAVGALLALVVVTSIRRRRGKAQPA